MENQNNNMESKATARLLTELAKGKESGEKYGWISADDARKHFQEMKNNKPKARRYPKMIKAILGDKPENTISICRFVVFAISQCDFAPLIHLHP